jgi:Fibronectin type III domain
MRPTRAALTVFMSAFLCLFTLPFVSAHGSNTMASVRSRRPAVASTTGAAGSEDHAGLSRNGPAWAVSSATAPTEQPSPPNEVVVVTVNAQQNTTDDARLSELAAALRNRPTTANGNFYPPDIIIANEMNNDASLMGLRDKLNATLSSTRYEIVGSTSPAVKTKFLFNSSTMTFDSATSWTDVCEAAIRYQLIRLRESATNKSVTVGGVHFRANYAAPDCRERNADEVRRQLDGATRSIVGDFNQRAAEIELECDPFETSGNRPWYAAMTSPSPIDGISYIDAVRNFRRSRNLSLAEEWTWEAKSTSNLCDGSTNYKRSRIDYLFASNNVGVLEAQADRPGWANEQQRGSIACTPAPQCKYSDHRFVWGRFDLSAIPAPVNPPPAPTDLSAIAASSTEVALSWTAATGATSYRVERSADGSTGWAQIATTTSPSYRDSGIVENSTRHYRVIATNSGGESGPSNVASATTPGSAPSNPSTLIATAGRRKVSLTWNGSTDSGGSGLAGYEIWRSTTGSAGSFSRIATTSGTSYTNTGLTRGRTYSYYVLAYDNAGNKSDPSNTASATAK